MRKEQKTKPDKKPCPICAKKYWEIDDAEWVCRNHQHFYVTKCSGCKRVMFSDARAICPLCASGAPLRQDPQL